MGVKRVGRGAQAALVVMLLAEVCMGMTDRQKAEWPLLIMVAQTYDLSREDSLMLLAIRDAEGGGKGYEFGVKAARGSDLATQAQWCAGSIRANRGRYRTLLQEGVYRGSMREVRLEGAQEAKNDAFRVVVIEKPDFVEFFSYYGSPTGFGWAPIHAIMPAHDKRSNKNFAPNVRRLMEKYEQMFKQGEVEL